MEIKPNKLSFIDKILLRRQFPKLPKEIFIKIKKEEYELMKKMVARQDNYIAQIQQQNSKINELEDEIKDKENKRRKNACKIGAMQKHINKQDQKLKEIIKTLEAKEMQLDIQKKQIEMLKNKGKRKKDVESYKNYFQTRKELERREKNE